MFVQDSPVVTHTIDWRADRITVSSGNETFTYPTDHAARIPTPGAENPRINLWLFNGQPPTNGLDQEVVIRSFRFER